MSNINQNHEILELEKLCEQLYNVNTNAQQIQEANKVLENFANSSDCLSKCKILLDRGSVNHKLDSNIISNKFSYFYV